MASDKAGENGLTNISPLLGKDLVELQNLKQQDRNFITNFLVALDSLHNTKGHLSTVIKRLQKDSGWNETVFKELFGGMTCTYTTEDDRIHSFW
jgi:hypothetical protein